VITDAATGTKDTPGGLGAILTQVDKEGKCYLISFLIENTDLRTLLISQIAWHNYQTLGILV
jgi:hypothetical protein